MMQQGEKIDIDQALLDPAAMFASPEQVARDMRLSLVRKVEILRRWAYDAAAPAIAA